MRAGEGVVDGAPSASASPRPRRGSTGSHGDTSWRPLTPIAESPTPLRLRPPAGAGGSANSDAHALHGDAPGTPPHLHADRGADDGGGGRGGGGDGYDEAVINVRNVHSSTGSLTPLATGSSGIVSGAAPTSTALDARLRARERTRAAPTRSGGGAVHSPLVVAATAALAPPDTTTRSGGALPAAAVSDGGGADASGVADTAGQSLGRE